MVNLNAPLKWGQKNGLRVPKRLFQLHEFPISSLLIHDLNLQNPRFQPYELRLQLHDFNFMNSRLQLHEYPISVS
jgi:hypothetical protein